MVRAEALEDRVAIETGVLVPAPRVDGVTPRVELAALYCFAEYAVGKAVIRAKLNENGWLLCFDQPSPERAVL